MSPTPAQIAQAAEEAIAHFNGVFGLVNNAGIFPRVSILDVTPETWRAVLGVNLLGTVFCSQALARDMVKRGRGVVVNIASGRALQGTPRGAHYAASKAGIVSFTKSFALEFAAAGPARELRHPRRDRDRAAARRHHARGAARARQAHPARPHRPAGGHRARGRVPVQRGRSLHDRAVDRGERRRDHDTVEA